MDPKRTLELLNELEELGLNDEAFWRLHHFRPQKRETIAGFRAYCEKTSTFRPGGTNERVHQRLALVLKTYHDSGLPPGNTKVLIALADAALVEKPLRPSAGGGDGLVSGQPASDHP
jgi:hypothetical protein